MRRGGLIGKGLELLQETTGQVVVPAERMELLEATYDDHRILSRQLDSIGYTVLNYLGGQSQEMQPMHRLRVVQQARVVWMNDPQAGASVELMNDFCFGRGIPRPRAKDQKVQDAIDKAWDDPDNQEVLTTIEAQLALGTDLALQSNIFVLVFGLEEGDGPGIKLSLLRHDDVTGYVPHPDKRHRVLYYLARELRQVWDYKLHAFKPIDPASLLNRPTYYAHWRNVDLSEEEDKDGTGADEAPVGADPVEYAPAEYVGKGRVYHLRINRTSEMMFGVPRFQRTMTWYSAYNKFVKDRLDIVAAAAALIMKRKIKGSPSQITRDAAKALSRVSPLAAADPGGLLPQSGPRAASIIDENESVQHEAFNLDTRAGNAQQDAQIIGAPISAAERFPRSYYGDPTNSNLAMATSLELPVLKAVENRQEVFEGLVRFFTDRVIEKAVDSGEIPEELDPQEIEKLNRSPWTPGDQDPDAGAAEMQQSLEEAARAELDAGREIVEVARVRPRVAGELDIDPVVLLVSMDDDGYHYTVLQQGYEDQETDEVDTERNLSYEFSMPSPLRRMMGDLITAVMNIAQTFDPNNTNPRLSRALLTIALGEGLEVQDAPDLVDEIFPEGYVDPIVKAQMDAAAQPVDPNAQDPNNPYHGPMQSTMPEDMRSAPYQAQESRIVGRTRARDGSEVLWTRRKQLAEGHDDRAEPVRRQIEGDRDDAQEMFARDVVGTALDSIDRETLLPTGSDNNGSGGG